MPCATPYFRHRLLLLAAIICCGCGSPETPRPEAIGTTAPTCRNTDTAGAAELFDSLCQLYAPPEIYRSLTDSEINNLNFDHLTLSDDGMKFIFDDWRSHLGHARRPYYSAETCPKCGCRLLVIYSETPSEYWESLCGWGGSFIICTHCQQEWRHTTEINN